MGTLATTAEIHTILSMRLATTGRRHPSTPLVIVFGWIIGVFALFQTWASARRLLARPAFAELAEAAIVPALVFLFAAGIPATWRLVSDARWFGFLHSRGFRPVAVLAALWLERFIRTMPAAAFVAVYARALHAAGFLSSVSRMLVATLICSMLLATLQLAAAMLFRVLSRPGYVRAVTVVVFALAMTYPFVVRLEPPSPAHHPLMPAFRQITSHPAVWLAGIGNAAFIAGTAPRATCWRLIAGILLRTAACGVLMWLLLRYASERFTHPGEPARSRLIGMPFCTLLRHSPAAWLTQGILELLLVFRQGNVVVVLYALGALIALAIARTWPSSSPGTLELLPLVGLALAHGIGTDGVSEILGRRRPFRLYRACGTDPGDYGLGLALAVSVVSLLIVMACLPVALAGHAAWKSTVSALSAFILTVADAALATLISLYLFPIMPRLGILGQIKSGLILVASAWLMLLLFSGFMPLPLLLVGVFWAYKKRHLAEFVWRRLWNADQV